MTIRKANYKETSEILSHSREVLEEATMGFVTLGIDNSDQIAPPFLSDNGYYLVHIDHDVIHGWIGVEKVVDYYTHETVGIISEVYVLPPYRGKSIAKKLCKKAIKHFKEEGHKKVQLNVYSGNHAKYLYQKLGFQDVSTLMEKPLDL
ncbi:N-acetyltransferase [Paenisporosarcina sp. TG20]|uniref:GNAT family N-acetyltransferase n=1 Tax=Paenisporosarcina sp. TG20 TaxID=1211706 RepID=UPI0003193C15|nr:GNAT family N-acetyltransferase [Paenisporosarcina sp. TG20]